MEKIDGISYSRCMSVTSHGNTVLDAMAGRILVVAALPTTPSGYYGAGAVGYDEWRGGEIVYLTSDEKIYVQQNESGTTATWKVLDSAFATSTTSSSTSTSSSSSSTSSSTSSSSSSTSTSTSSSSTSSTTSTSTSTSSSSSSSSTSSSSTTTS